MIRTLVPVPSPIVDGQTFCLLWYGMVVVERVERRAMTYMYIREEVSIVGAGVERVSRGWDCEACEAASVRLHNYYIRSAVAGGRGEAVQGGLAVLLLWSPDIQVATTYDNLQEAEVDRYEKKIKVTVHDGLHLRFLGSKRGDDERSIGAIQSDGLWIGNRS